MNPFRVSNKSSSSTEFDVFLSFRGDDTRKGFASHLFEALRERQIRTFMDEDNLERGERLKDRILQAIEASTLCIPILSKGYAESVWCLKELAKIVQCKKKIIPVFYHVDPSDVRHQKGPFKAAFNNHQQRVDSKTVTEWRKAMAAVGYISGYDVDNVANGNEAKLIRLIVEKIVGELVDGPWNWSDNGVIPGGGLPMQEREQHLKQFTEQMGATPLIGAQIQNGRAVKAMQEKAKKQQQKMQSPGEFNHSPHCNSAPPPQGIVPVDPLMWPQPYVSPGPMPAMQVFQPAPYMMSVEMQAMEGMPVMAEPPLFMAPGPFPMW